eukprot:4020297-Pleurochrysis_carterae.AAC.1
MAARPPSPSLSRRSVAPPMRQHFPPNRLGSSPHAAAMRRATFLDVSVDHASSFSSSVKKGLVLGRPCVRSDSGTLATRASHAARRASYAQM